MKAIDEIIEYRKATAEALGAVMNYAHGLIKLQGKMYRTDETLAYAYPLWIPDTDHDQMAMVKKLLIDQGYRILMDLYSTEKKVFIYPHGIKGSSYDCYEFSDKSELTAFRKAFMKYYKTKQDGRD